MALWNKQEDKTGSNAPTPSTTPPVTKPRAAASSTGSVLGKGIQMEGKIQGREDVRLEGRFQGQIRVPEAQVSVAPGAEIKADILGKIVLVEGQVVGDIQGEERVVVRGSAVVEGNISATRVILEDGCRVMGAIDMAGRKHGSAKGTPPPASKAATG